MRTKFTLLLAALCVFPLALHADTYKVDLDHSTVGFKVRHLLSWVHGSFRQFEGNFSYDASDPLSWKAEAVVQAASIDTNVPQRDKHLQSKDFFDVENFLNLSFKSTTITDVSGGKAKLHGILKIHGIEKEVVFDLEMLGEVTDPWGNQTASFSATTTINRKDFGLTWNQAVETGQLLVGEEIKIELEITGVKEG